ncbi:NADH dehydrogenase [ubiquinone] 1 beta subcomplex subunit 1 [Pelobates cultripes]|uniref:NADH dehydrogenase [ubiquinone] 1 beta subcomplex subunit 1 n=2 Tax=Pelobates TaxID=61615 RepID=A0AAD1WX94_PELCU|nr:NADH dehydrogenase [ubiquinone] 1 beta subcomplex subunit 1 [Pelobates cultripes]
MYQSQAGMVSPNALYPCAGSSVCSLGRTHSVAMVNIIGIVREHWPAVLVPMGFVIGWYLDRRNNEKLSMFRNRSVLYRRELKPGEEVTWR